MLPARHFIFVSFDTNGMPDAPLVAAKRDVELHLKDSGLEYTVLHPPLFMESWLGPILFADTTAGTATVYGNRDVKFRYVAVADVAEVAVRCVGHPAARNAVIPFGGPEALTQREALERFEGAFAKRFTVTELAEEALEARWKTAPVFAICCGAPAWCGARRCGRVRVAGRIPDSDDDGARVCIQPSRALSNPAAGAVAGDGLLADRRPTELFLPHHGTTDCTPPDGTTRNSIPDACLADR